MLPSKPKIQPVKGGAGRDQITSGWGNGIISQNFLPSEEGAYVYQDTSITNEETGETIRYYDIFGKIESSTGPNTCFATGNIFDGLDPYLPQQTKFVSDVYYAFLVEDEILETADFKNYQSVHGSHGLSTGDWLRDPEPYVTVNGEEKTLAADYYIDYVNGKVVFNEVIKGDTTLSSDISAGASTISVVSETGFEEGDLIVVAGDTSLEDEIKTVSSVSTGSVTLSSSLEYSHTAGAIVVENSPVVKATYRYIEQHISKYEFLPANSNPQPPLLPASFCDYSERRDESSGILRLKNPIFSNWNNGEPEGWTKGGDGTSVTTEGSGILGDSCLQLETTPDTNWSYYSQTYTGVSSGYVEFSCWVKTDSKAMIEIIPTGYSSVTTTLDCASSCMTSFKNKWVRVSVVTASGVNPIEVRLYGQINSTDGGVAMFDGASLVQL